MENGKDMFNKIIDKGSDLYFTNTKHFGSLFNGDSEAYRQIRNGYLRPHFTNHRTKWGFMDRPPLEHQLWDI